MPESIRSIKLKNESMPKTLLEGVSIDDPPKIFTEGVKGWKARHDEVLNYSRMLFHDLASEETLWQAQMNASKYAAFYTGSEHPQPTGIDLSMVSANLINTAINLKNSTLLNHRLEMHYVAEKNSDYDLAVAVQRLFDWQALKTKRDKWKARVELNSMIKSCGALVMLPKDIYRGKRLIRIPAQPKYVDLRQMFFDPYKQDDDDITCFIYREICDGHLLDQEYKSLLDSRGLDQFARGPAFSIWNQQEGDEPLAWNYSPVESLYTDDQQKWLSRVGNNVEVIRVWKKDCRTIRAKLYKPFIDPQTKQIDKTSDTTEAQYARYVAEQELMPIMMTGRHMPASGENHYNMLLVHHADLEQMKADIKMPDTETTPEMIKNMEIHIEATGKLLDSGDQAPDQYYDVPMFDGQWRFIKIIGDTVVADGSLDLEYDTFPVTIFRPSEDPNTCLGLSDVAELANLNAALNSLMADLLMNSHDNAFPDKRLPQRFRNSEEWKIGETLFVTDEDQSWMFDPVSVGQFPVQSLQAINLFRQFIEIVSGGNSTVRGEAGQVRSSGVETQTKIIAAQQRYMSTEVLYGFAWERFAEITLGQIIQCMRGENLTPIIGPEYQHVEPILINAIDPYATIHVIRVPKDADFENQNGQTMHQLAIIGVQQFGLPPEAVISVLARQGDGGTVSRIYGQFLQEISRPEVQQKMAEQQQLMAMQATRKSGSK